MAKKSKRVKRRRRRRILFGIELFLLLILIGGLFLYAKVNEKMNKINMDGEVTDVEVNENVIGSSTLKGFTNIALFGVDIGEGDIKSGRNSDTTIIASINNETKEVKLVSLYRDTYLNIGEGQYTKCNAAYSAGGPQQAMSMINTNLDLNITNYVAVDFKALSTVIDCLGGLDVEMSYEEIVHTNNYCVGTSEYTGMDYTPIELPEVPDDMNESMIIGTYHLNGTQATSYCRIRKTNGWDMKRTERQRYIISLIVEKAKKAKLSTLSEIMDEVFPMIYTDFSKEELIKLGTGIIAYNLGETSGFPKSLNMGPEVVDAIGLDCVIPTTLEANVRYLHEFLFNDKDYDPSGTVLDRSDYIISHTGFGNGYVSDELKKYIVERESESSGTYSESESSETYSEEPVYHDSDSETYSNDYSSSDESYDDSEESYTEDYSDESYSEESYSEDYSEEGY